MKLIAGVDEAGRGPLAGPVVACAVILGCRLHGLKDSKQLTELKRESLAEKIKLKAMAWSLGFASVKEIDRYNILQASMLAMQRAVEHLPVLPTQVLVDGNRLPRLNIPAEAIVDGDNLVAEISAASIIAKVTRDYLMGVLAHRYPQYGFAKHKGYGTKEHLQAIDTYGIAPIHRLSFAPVRNAQHKFEVFG